MSCAVQKMCLNLVFVGIATLTDHLGYSELEILDFLIHCLHTVLPRWTVNLSNT